MSRYHKFFLAAMIFGSSISFADMDWSKRQQKEMRTLRQDMLGEEPEKITDSLVREDKKFLETAMQENVFEDSISSRLAAPMRDNPSQIEKEQADQELEMLVPKSNPFERKFRRR